MSKLLLYHNDFVSTVTVLEASCDVGTENLQAYGPNLDDWPEDLDAYKHQHGIFIWEGTIPEGDEDKWTGELRPLTSDEGARLNRGEAVFDLP